MFKLTSPGPSLNTLVCVLPLSLGIAQLNKAIRVVLILVFRTDHLTLGRKRVKGETLDCCMEMRPNHKFSPMNEFCTTG